MLILLAIQVNCDTTLRDNRRFLLVPVGLFFFVLCVLIRFAECVVQLQYATKAKSLRPFAHHNATTHHDSTHTPTYTWTNTHTYRSVLVVERERVEALREYRPEAPRREHPPPVRVPCHAMPYACVQLTVRCLLPV